MTYSQLAYDRYMSPAINTAPPYNPNDAEQWLIKDVNDTFDDDLNPMLQQIHQEWFECILYYLGEQWIQYDQGGGLRKIDKADWIPTPVDNVIQTAVEVGVSNMHAAKFFPRVRPNSNLPDDYYAARVGERLSINMDEDPTFWLEVDWVYLWSAIVGTGFMAHDVLKMPNRRVVLPVPPGEGRRSGALMDDEIEFGSEYEDFGTDVEVDCRHLNPFWVRVSDLSVDLNIKRCEWWGWQEIVSLDYIRENFPDTAKWVQHESFERTAVRYQAKLAELVGSASTRVIVSSHGTRGSLYGKLDNHCIIKRKEWRPSLDYPRGRCAIVASNVLLYDGPLPISDDEGVAEFSGVDYHYRRVTGRFWSKGMVKDLLSPQDRINGIDAQVVLNRKTCINPQKLIPLGSGITNWDGEPGKEIKWDPTQTMGHEPRVIAGVPLAPQIWNERVGMTEAVKESSGSEDILKGKAPQGVRAGIALDMLEEKAASRHYHRDNRMKLSLSRTYKIRLVLAHLHYSVPKMLKHVGEDNSWEITQFVGSQLRGNTDIVLEPDSGIARTAAGRTYLMTQLLSNGLINIANPIERSEVFRRLGMHGFKTEVSKDVDRAHRENQLMSSGQGRLFEEESVFMVDDHHIHVALHTDYMKQSNFLELPQQIQEEFVSHVASHIEAAMQQQLQQQAVPMPPGQEPQQVQGTQTAPMTTGGENA